MSRPSVPKTLRAAQVMLGLLGALVVVSSIYFTWFEPPAVSFWFDPAVTAYALAAGVAAIVLAVKLPGGDPRVRAATFVVLATHAAFNVLNATAYEEPEAVNLIVWDLLIAGLLIARPASRFFEPRAAGA